MEKLNDAITPAMWVIIAALGGVFFAYVMYQDSITREINAATVGYELRDLSTVAKGQ